MSRTSPATLLVLFAALYFVQGIVEPTACLPAQPLQSQLQAWRLSATEIGYFFGAIGLAWSVKPLFGALSDWLPLGGRRRRPYLIFSTALTAGAFLALAATANAKNWPAFDSANPLFEWLARLGSQPPQVSRTGWLLLLASAGIAMTDVAIDALAVETGQTLRFTGQIQAVQWAALSLAGLLVGSAGGYVAALKQQVPMFALCGCLALGSCILVAILVREPRTYAPAAADPAAVRLTAPATWRILLAAAAFLWLWNFNPFSSNVLQDYSTTQLRFSQQFYGHLVSLQALGNLIACILYYYLAPRVPFGRLLHLAVLAGLISTLAYWFYSNAPTAVAVSLVFGFAYQLGLLVQLDLAARICPTAAAATGFALLMAISNSGVTAATYVGGHWYDQLATSLASRHSAFHALVIVGAAFTALCWLVIPFLRDRDLTPEQDLTQETKKAQPSSLEAGRLGPR